MVEGEEGRPAGQLQEGPPGGPPIEAKQCEGEENDIRPKVQAPEQVEGEL